MSFNALMLALGIALLVGSCGTIVWVKSKVVEEVNSRVPVDQRKSSWQWSRQGRSVLWNLHKSLVPKSNLQILTEVSAVMAFVAVVLVIVAFGKIGH